MDEIERGIFLGKISFEEIQKLGLEVIFFDSNGNKIIKCPNYHPENPIESQCIKDSSVGFCVKCKFNGGK